MMWLCSLRERRGEIFLNTLQIKMLCRLLMISPKANHVWTGTQSEWISLTVVCEVSGDRIGCLFKSAETWLIVPILIYYVQNYCTLIHLLVNKCSLSVIGAIKMQCVHNLVLNVVPSHLLSNLNSQLSTETPTTGVSTFIN